MCKGNTALKMYISINKVTIKDCTENVYKCYKEREKLTRMLTRDSVNLVMEVVYFC